MPRQFDASSTTDEVLSGIDLTGKNYLVTGISSGLGLETARALASRGAHVLGTARDVAKAREALALIGALSGKGLDIEVVHLDLGSLRSVRACSNIIIRSGLKIDAIIANAGVMAPPLSYTEDGFESQFGVNHLGHFVLINRLAPSMTTGSRVVMISSAGHRFADIDLEDPNFRKTSYDPFIAYGRSKTSNILFAVAFDDVHRARGVRATAVHPGGIQTELMRHLNNSVIQAMIEKIDADRPDGAPRFEWKTIPQGAATAIWAACVAASEQIGGRYCEDCQVADVVEDPAIRGGVRAYALDLRRAEALWALSEELVGERF